jgi:hypothetical protein
MGFVKVIRSLISSVLVMEALSRILGAFTSKGLISGFSVGTGEPDRVIVSHLPSPFCG